MIQKHWWRWLTSYFFWKPLINLCQLHKVMVSQFVIFWRPSRYVKDNFMPLCSLNISLYHKWIDLSRILWIAHMSEYTQDGWCIWTLLKTCKTQLCCIVNGKKIFAQHLSKDTNGVEGELPVTQDLFDLHIVDRGWHTYIFFKSLVIMYLFQFIFYILYICFKCM